MDAKPLKTWYPRIGAAKSVYSACVLVYVYVCV